MSWIYHPKPQTRIISLRSICPDALASRSQTINPWIPSSEPVCTITKTPYVGLIRTAEGVREPTIKELKIFGGFPESYKFNGGKKVSWNRIGNAVPPLLMKAIADNIRHHQRIKSIAKPTVISTFAGCGGSSLGYQMAGFHELLAVEFDSNAVACLKANFPGLKIYPGDIRNLKVEQCLEMAGIKSGELDVLDGSPPCQGFSTAGRRKFMDPRNSLFMEFVRLLNGLHPKFFVMENVTGLIKGAMKQIYLQIVADLRACGYKVKGEVLNAMYYGVPQSRERVIIIGVRNDIP